MFQKMTMDTSVVYQQTLSFYGTKIQYMTAIEEMAELEQMLSKWTRYSDKDLSDNQKDVLLTGILAEIGDSINMIEQVLTVHNCLDMVQGLMDVEHEEYVSPTHMFAETIASMCKLKMELTMAISMHEMKMGYGIDASSMAVYSGEVLKRFNDLIKYFSFDKEALRIVRENKLDRCLKRMEQVNAE